MSDPLTDAANAINSASVNIRKFAQLAAQRIEADEAHLSAVVSSVDTELKDLAARVAKLEGTAPLPPVSGPYSALTQATADALAGKNLQLKAGEGIAAAAGEVTLRCTVEMFGTGSVIADSIILKRDSRHTLSGMVAVSADNCRIACEIDCSSMKCQGVQLGTLVAAIRNPDTSGLYVHDIVEGAFTSPQYHGVYCSSCDGWVGDNMLFQRISGWGVQFNGNPVGAPINSKLSRFTTDGCWGGVVYWDGAANNAVSKALLMGSKGAPAVSGKTLAANPKPDYVTTPTAGYGYV